MRKLLLGTSALIGATALVASASAAPELTISGNLNFQWTGGEAPALSDQDGTSAGAVAARAAAGNDVGASQSGWRFDQLNSQSEIRFHAEAESDGGTTYGAQIDYRYLQTGAGSATDEAYIFVSGDWGTVHLGQDDGAVNQTRFYAGSVGVGATLIDGTTTYAGYSANDTGDNSKILYVSNDLSGFKFALSVAQATGTTYEDIYEIGASYTADFGEGHIGLSAGYFSASAAAATEDLAEYVLGLKAGFGPISFAASYADEDDSGLAAGNNIEGQSIYTVGLSYDLGGGMGVGIYYAEAEHNRTGTNEVTHDLTTLDFGFPIMEGMSGYAGIAFSERENSAATPAANAAGNADATTYVIGTTVSF